MFDLYALLNFILKKEVLLYFLFTGVHTLQLTTWLYIIDRLYENETVRLPGNEEIHVKYLKKRCPKGCLNWVTSKFNLDPESTALCKLLNCYVMIQHYAECAIHPDSRNYIEKFARGQNSIFQGSQLSTR